MDKMQSYYLYEFYITITKCLYCILSSVKTGFILAVQTFKLSSHPSLPTRLYNNALSYNDLLHANKS